MESPLLATHPQANVAFFVKVGTALLLLLPATEPQALMTAQHQALHHTRHSQPDTSNPLRPLQRPQLQPLPKPRPNAVRAILDQLGQQVLQDLMETTARTVSLVKMVHPERTVRKTQPNPQSHALTVQTHPQVQLATLVPKAHLERQETQDKMEAPPPQEPKAHPDLRVHPENQEPLASLATEERRELSPMYRALLDPQARQDHLDRQDPMENQDQLATVKMANRDHKETPDHRDHQEKTENPARKERMEKSAAEEGATTVHHREQPQDINRLSDRLRGYVVVFSFICTHGGTSTAKLNNRCAMHSIIASLLYKRFIIK